MIDVAVFVVRGGKGGNGCVAFRRERGVPFGGPNGGGGGKGGSVYLLGDASLTTLQWLVHKARFAADDGKNGMGKGWHGKNGEDLEIRVPCGTLVYEVSGKKERLLADITDDGQKVLVAKGGRGGRGNESFATSTNRAPVLAEKGEPGRERKLRLELKLLADAGVVGMPNAGKSSLVTAVSAARPKIADYPFTTLEPVLGVVNKGWTSFVIAEIPGLIEGAHLGAGLGHEFIKHIERTRVLVHLVDGGHKDVRKVVDAVNEELRLYSEDILQKPQIVAVNKIDIPEVKERMESIRQELESLGHPVYFISAVTREGLDALMDRVGQMVQEAKAAPQPVREEALPVVDVKRRGREPVVVEKVGDAFVVKCAPAERFVEGTPLATWSGRVQLKHRLDILGVTEALEKAGAVPGDTVRFGDIELEW